MHTFAQQLQNYFLHSGLLSRALRIVSNSLAFPMLCPQLCLSWDTARHESACERGGFLMYVCFVVGFVGAPPLERLTSRSHGAQGLWWHVLFAAASPGLRATYGQSGNACAVCGLVGALPEGRHFPPRHTGALGTCLLAPRQLKGVPSTESS